MFFIDPSSHEIGRSPSSAPAAFTPSVRWGIGIDVDDFRLSPTASSERFSFHLLRAVSPLLAGYWQLRSDIFCQEQHLFEASDRDELDKIAYPIVAINHALSQEQAKRQGQFQVQGQSQGQVQVQGQAVGVVRILEQSPRVWYGGRLGVDVNFRRHNQIGKGLIWKAVTTANGWGCDQFLATVQQQNVRFFQRLHWQSIEQLEIRGVTHQLMQADLSYYQPARECRPALVAA
jgi:putative N-acetyltransferase (TIGR04045 family)